MKGLPLVARTITDKAEVLAAASAARRKAQQEEAAALNALTAASGPGDEVLGEGELIADLVENAGYTLIGGKTYRLALRSYNPPGQAAPPVPAPSVPVPAPAPKP